MVLKSQRYGPIRWFLIPTSQLSRSPIATAIMTRGVFVVTLILRMETEYDTRRATL